MTHPPHLCKSSKLYSYRYQLYIYISVMSPRLRTGLLNPDPPLPAQRTPPNFRWRMLQDGKIVSQWAGRSVICTCAKLAYQDAQAVIDALPQSSSAPAPPSLQLHGGHTWDKVTSGR